MTADETVLIVGSGLMGASIGLALRRAGVDVALTDIDPARVAEAEGMGAGRTRVDGNITCVVVCVPPQHTANVLAEYAERFPEATLTDIASVKSPILEQAAVHGVPATRFIGGHPMAGRERTGPLAARSDLLDDRWWVLTPTAEAEPAHIERVEGLARTCRALPVIMSPAEHDRAVALVSHAPQVIASVLATQLLNAPASEVAIAGQGLRDMTRIAGSDPQLWADILTGNAGPVAAVLDTVTADLDRIRTTLSAANADAPATREAMSAVVAAGVAGRARIPGKHGDEEAQYSVISVMVADQPGQLAALVVAAGNAHINIEDIRIEHVLGRPSGLIELFVQPASGAKLEQVLRDTGFDVRT